MALMDAARRLLGRADDSLYSKDRQEFLVACADLGDERLGRYRTYEEFYDGEQRSKPLQRARDILEVASGIRFAENIIETGVDKYARRFRVEGFEVDGNEAASDWLTKRLWGRQGELQSTVHTEVPKLGDGFVIVEWDHQHGRPELRWNRPSLIKAVYDDDCPDRLLHAPKKWSTSRVSPVNPRGDLVWRLNIYYPDRVEKWFTPEKDGKNWAPWRDEDDELWPTPWTESGTLPDDGEADDPIGMSVIHFRNRAKGRRYGRSEVRGMIPYQLELNKQLLDLFYVMDSQGWKQRWATGVSDGNALKTAIGEWVRTANHEARFGEFEAEDPRPMVETIDATLRRFAAKTDTPLHDLIKSGTPPTGESRKMAEAGAVSKAEEQQVSTGRSWEEVARIAWRLGALYGDDVPPYDPKADITAVWDSAETRDELHEATYLEAHQRLGASKATILRKLGYDPDDEAKQRQEEAETAAEAQAKAFSAGNPPFGGGYSGRQVEPTPKTERGDDAA